MPDKAMFVEERKIKILEFINEHKKATVATLCDRFYVSGATIRNDLRDLEAANLLVRTHGGAMVKTKTGFELTTSQKQVCNLEQKQSIARTAIQLIEDGDTILLDTGTTTLELAKLLFPKRDITVVTNDLPIALLLEEADTFKVVFMGGLIREGFHCTVTYGNLNREMLSGLTVDKAFMGTNSFSLENGASTPDISHAETKKLMISIALKVILLCDSSKLGKTSFAQFARLEEIDLLVTDQISQSNRSILAQQDVEVLTETMPVSGSKA